MKKALLVSRAVLFAASIGVVCVPGSTHAGSHDVVSKVKSLFMKEPSPEEVLTTHFEALKKGDFDTAYELLSSADRAFRTKEKFADSQRNAGLLALVLKSSISMKVKRVVVDRNKAVATVEVTYPDMKVLFAAMFSRALNKNSDEMEDKLAERLASGDVPMTVTVNTEYLVREADGWRVYKGFEVKSHVEKLLQEAKNLAERKKYGEAIEKYDEALTVESDVVKGKQDRAREEREEVVSKLATAREKNEYIKKVVLYDLKSRYHETFLDKRVPGVEFKIRNKGNRTLRKVEVTVYFKDAKGSVIHEKNYTPVLFLKDSYRQNNSPLRPGYIWQIERGKFYQAKSVPSEWKEGSVEARITDIEFSD